MPAYRIAGLVLRSAVPLPAPQVEAEPDIVLELAPARTIPNVPPEGETWIDAEFGPNLRTILVRHEGGYTLRYLGICEVAINPTASTWMATPDPKCAPGFVSVLASASILAVALGLRGKTALHSSSVVIDGRAVALVGLSGSGKSTLASALCVGGASLLSDDLLCLDPAQSWRVPFSSNQIRLRDRAIAERLQIAPTALSQTADQRWAFHPEKLALEGAELAAIVLPRVTPEPPVNRLERMDPAEVLSALSADGRRTMGVVHPSWMARDFLTFARVAREIPAYRWHLARGHYEPAALRTGLSALLARP